MIDNIQIPAFLTTEARKEFARAHKPASQTEFRSASETQAFREAFDRAYEKFHRSKVLSRVLYDLMMERGAEIQDETTMSGMVQELLSELEADFDELWKAGVKA